MLPSYILRYLDFIRNITWTISTYTLLKSDILAIPGINDQHISYLKFIFTTMANYQSVRFIQKCRSFPFMHLHFLSKNIVLPTYIYIKPQERWFHTNHLPCFLTVWSIICLTPLQYKLFCQPPSSVIRLMTYSSELELPQTWHTDDSTAEDYFRMLTGAILWHIICP